MNQVQELRGELGEAEISANNQVYIMHACDGLYSAWGYLGSLRDELRDTENNDDD